MVSVETVRTLALSFPEADEQPHFEKASFRIKKKIFATLSEKDKRCTVKLSPVDQSVFVSSTLLLFTLPRELGVNRDGQLLSLNR
jgi:predicted DNA-binding protein (MmcQ/YjbR family)